MDRYETLSAARDVLDAWKDEAEQEAIATRDPERALRLGRLVEAADAAEEAVFNALNTAWAYAGDEGAKAAIDERLARA